MFSSPWWPPEAGPAAAALAAAEAAPLWTEGTLAPGGSAESSASGEEGPEEEDMLQRTLKGKQNTRARVSDAILICVVMKRHRTRLGH